jgi:hypothetical protein
MTVDYNRIFGGHTGLRITRWGTGVVEENQIGGTGRYAVSLEDPDTTGYTWHGQDFFRDPSDQAFYWSGATAMTFSTWQSTTHLGTSTPLDVNYGPQLGLWWSTYATAFPANKYEHGRGIIVVFNKNTLGSIDVSLGNYLNSGETYKIYNVFDLVNPVKTGTYLGGTVNIPLAEKSPPDPAWRHSLTAGEPTGPFFFTFIVTKG